MKKILVTMVLAGLLLVPAGLALAAKLVDVRIPVSFTGYNPCNGEEVGLSGRLHYLISVTDSPGGGFHLDVHANAEGLSGTGQTTSAKYEVNYTDTFQLNLTNGATEATTPFHLNVIAQGQVPNFLLHGLFHITVNANGDLTTYVDTFSVDCR